LWLPVVVLVVGTLVVAVEPVGSVPELLRMYLLERNTQLQLVVALPVLRLVLLLLEIMVLILLLLEVLAHLRLPHPVLFQQVVVAVELLV
jgi:hypothetical protein